MIRKYRVTVAGRTYEVEVEELDSGGAAVRSAGRASPQAAEQAVPAAPDAPAAPAARAPKVRPPSAARGGVVTSPLSGKVLSVKAQAGQKVKRGDLLLVIEAMKMENEIFAGEEGTVNRVHVASGQNVEAGDPLVELQPGA
jgi:glutaconyl-CoA decarboxylase